MTARIFSDSTLVTGRTVTLTGSAATHIGKVLRLRAGDSIVLFDGSGREYVARIESVRRQAVSVVVGTATDPGTEPNLVIQLLQGICRGQRMDMLIQKSTELGVAAIHTMSCERSVVRLDASRADRKTEHWRQVAISACEQSGRLMIPPISGPATLADTLEALAADPGARLLLDPRADRNLGDALGDARAVLLLVGPEGGLTDGERNAARAAGFESVRMGPRILRTETAPLAAISILQYLAGDLA